MHLVTVFWNENIKIDGYGLNGMSSVYDFIYWSPNPGNLRMWLCLETEAFKQVIKLKPGFWGVS